MRYRWLQHSCLLVVVAPVAAQDPTQSEEMRRQLEELRRRADQLEARIDGRPPPPVPDDADDVEGLDTAGWDGKFFLRTRDGRFRLNLGGYAQFRYDLNVRDTPPPDEDKTTEGFTIRRARILADGNYTDAIDYELRLDISDEGDVSLVNFWSQWNIDDAWSIRAGKTFLMIFRESSMYGYDVLGTDFSPEDYEFGIGASLGVQAHYQGQDWRSWFAISDGASGGGQSFDDVDVADWALSGRAEWQISGDDWSIWRDLIGRRDRPPGVLLGLAGAYQQGGDLPLPDRAALITADLSVSGSGFTGYTSGIVRIVDPQGGGATYANYGFLLQGGYFFTQKSQVYGRYDLISPGDQPGNLSNFNAVTLGYNFVPFDFTNKFKLTLETSYLADPLSRTLVASSPGLGFLPADEGGQIYFRIQAQFGF